MKKLLKWVLPGAFAVFASLQLFNPPRTNPPVKNDFVTAAHPPGDVAAVIHAACYDCHSYETKWPWYAHVAPVSWFIVSDVKNGREHLELSDWPADPRRAARQLERINEALDYREMPLKRYTLIHADARLTEAQRKKIMDWTDATAAKLRGAAKK
ncbi:MAG: heme-binding domain-containing protein [Verrucomicrobiota bacterium]|nr:heme-binding domain-containing protein [Verrucomicrobiota bacterium]